MATTPEHIDEWRQTKSETRHLEFKEAKEQFDGRTLCEYCVALSNEGGGKLLLGIADKHPRAVVGTKALGNPVKTEGWLLDKLGFRVDIEEVAHPDGRVVVVHIPGRPPGMPRDLDGAYYMRVGERLVPMKADRLQAIFAEVNHEPPAPPAPDHLDHERMLAADLLNRVTPHVDWPRRAAYVWPYSAPRPLFQPYALVRAVEESLLPVPADYRLFMPDIRTLSSLRKTNGLAWREQQAGDWAVGVGLDGSLAIEWQMWESDPGRSFVWGTNGIALGSTIDLLVGALAFSDRLLRRAANRRPVHWVLALQSVEGRRIAYDGPGAENWFYQPYAPTAAVQVVDATGSLTTEVTREAISGAIRELITRIDYFFGSAVNHPYVEQRIERALDFVMPGTGLEH